MKRRAPPVVDDPPRRGGPSESDAAPARVVPVVVEGHRGLWIDLPSAPRQLPAILTDAERDVVELVLSGRSNQEIAALRERSYRTVANQLAAIYKKLGVASRTELIARLEDADDAMN